MAPVLASTGSGNHVALFSYYALLDVAILGIAWFKAWRVLNVLGFVFTFGIATLWGIDGVQARASSRRPSRSSCCSRCMYLVIPVLFATAHAAAAARLRRRHADVRHADRRVRVAEPARRRHGVRSRDQRRRARARLRRHGHVSVPHAARELRVLVEAQLALGVAFVTVAVPLALDARWTSAAWALQGAALVWLAFRQQRKLALLAGLALQALSGVAYVEQAPVRRRLADLERLLPRRAAARARGILLGAVARSRARAAASQQPRCRTGSRSCCRSRCSSGRRLVVLRRLRARSTPVASDHALAALLGSPRRTALLAMLLAARIDGRGSTGSASTLWPFAALAAGRRAARARSSCRRLRLARVAGRRRRDALVPARAREAVPGLAGALHATAIGSSWGSVAWEAHWLVARAADGVWPEAAVLALGAALVFATLRATRGLAGRSRRTRAPTRGRLRRRARRRRARDARAERAVGRRRDAAAVSCRS